MKRRPVEWLPAPDEDDETDDFQRIDFVVIEQWVATDQDQLLLPIRVIDKTGVTVNEEYTAVLKQYGGEGLLNDMLMADQELERGSQWRVTRWDSRLEVEPLEIESAADDDDE